MNCCSLVSLKLENGWTDSANFDLEIFVEVQGRFKRISINALRNPILSESQPKPENCYNPNPNKSTRDNSNNYYNNMSLEQQKQSGHTDEGNPMLESIALETNASINTSVKNTNKECTNNFGMNIRENVILENEHIHAKEKKNDANMLPLQHLLNNTSLSIRHNKKIDVTLKNTSNDHNYAKKFHDTAPYSETENINETDPNNTAKKFTNISNKKSIDKEHEIIGNDKNYANNSNEKVDNESVNPKKVSMSPILKAQNSNEQTKKCLQEFDDVLTEVQSRKNAEINDTEDFSLDEIEEILQGEMEDDNTYNFQEIKAIHADYTTNYNTFVRSTIDTVVVEVQREITERKDNNIGVISMNSYIPNINSDEVILEKNIGKSQEFQNVHSGKTENNIDNLNCEENMTKRIDLEIISIPSDTESEECKGENVFAKNNTTNSSEATQNIGIDMKETKQNVHDEVLRETQNADTISVRSDSDGNSEDGYHSSDFEFITESEAKLDGFIVNLHPEEHYNYPMPIKQYFNARIEDFNTSQENIDRAGSTPVVQNDSYAPRPTASNTAESPDGVLNDPNNLGNLKGSEIILNNPCSLGLTDALHRVQNDHHAQGPSAYSAESRVQVPFQSEAANKQRTNSDRVQNDFYGPGPSRMVGNDCEEENIDNSSECYEVPGEEQFVNMFHADTPGLPTSEIFFLENKSVRSRAPMFIQYEGIGFDMNFAIQGAGDSDNEYQNEAEESLEKIYNMYPTENTRRKRRRRY